MDSEFSFEYKFAFRSHEDAHYSRLASDLLQSAPNPLSFECVSESAPYSGRILVRRFGDIGLAEYQVSSAAGSGLQFVCERSQKHIAHNKSSEFVVSMWISGGTNQIITKGRAHTGQNRDFVVTSTDNPFCSHLAEEGRACNLSLPSSWDRIGDVRLENLFGKVFPGGERRHAGLVSYMEYLLSKQNSLALPGAAEKLYDVIALAINPHAKSDHQAGFLALIRNYIDIRCSDPDLDPCAVAAKFNISVRYLHQLFTSGDVTFTEYLIERRLQLAYQALTDSTRSKQTVLSIAFDCGFSNVNHFGLRFRKRFGCTPTELRHSLLANRNGI